MSQMRCRAGHLWPSLWDVLSWWGSALCATMACGTWFTAGLKRAAFALKKNDLASCCSSSLMKCTMPPDDLLMCFSLCSMVVRPPLTSPSRRLSGWTSLERRGSLWLRRRTLSTSEGIWILLRLVPPNRCSSCLWLSRLLALGRLKQPRPWNPSAVQLAVMAARCCKRLLCLCAVGGPGLRCEGVPNWTPSAILSERRPVLSTHSPVVDRFLVFALLFSFSSRPQLA